MWAVGTDKIAYRWDPHQKKWFAYGRRKDFARIDGETDGSALAVTDKGDLYYTNGKGLGATKWVKVGTRVIDIGLGGGVAWIAKSGEDGDSGQVWSAPNTGNGKFKWRQWDGGMVRIDVGPDGVVWGVNEQDDVFQFIGGNWNRQSVKAKDIGVGAEGTVWIVSNDYVANRGGGTLYRRDTRTKRWVREGKRLRTITAGPADQPAGVSATNEIWDKSARPAIASNNPDAGPTDGGPGEDGTSETTTDPAMQRRVVTKHPRNWYRLPGGALDLGLGHRGHIWVIGSDKFAYRWDTGRKSWVRHGTRQNFAHIDAADDGGALAVSDDGGLYFTTGKTTGRARWTRIATSVRDVGIGGGQAWITRETGNAGGNQVWRSAYNANGRFSWRRVVGSPAAGLFHIDVDRNGNAWGVTGENEIYRYDSGKWKKQNGRAIDIGIGADNTVWIVGNDVVDRLGGGTLAQFEARTQRWIKEGRRLRSVSAGSDGHPAGTSHANEIWIRNFRDSPHSRGTNLALRKKTSQSPQRRLRGHAARAVDGNADGNFQNGSVTDIRSGDTPPWLMVDLGAVYQIDSVRIYNRTDCCGDRLNGSIVEISNNGEWKEPDTTFSSTISQAERLNDFNVGKTGRYVRIRQTTRQVLGIAEIEVYGKRARVRPVAVQIDRNEIRARLPDDWTKLAGTALDMGLGSGGHMWVIGTDKFAYRWDAAKKEWIRHGSRRDFVRIDVAADGGALAVASSGGLFHTPGGDTANPKWTQVGGKTRDVGIGGGWVWITSTNKTSGGGLTARARYDASGKFNWQRATRGLVHIDAGEDGNAWGVDDKGDVYQLIGGNWRRHAGRKAADIGVGGDNTVWIVGADADDRAGGGTLYRLETGGGGWVVENVRLKTVTAGGQGQPAGINSANEIWARDFSGAATPVAVAGGVTRKPKGKTAKVSQVAGADAGLPEELKDIVLEQVKEERGFTTGQVMLNGIPAVVVTYTPQGKSAPNTIVWHRRFKFSDYMTEAGRTPLDNVGTLNNAAFVIVPQANANTKIPAAIVTYLDTLRGGEGNAFPSDRSLKAGVNLIAGFDAAQMPGSKIFKVLFNRQPKNFNLGGTVDKSIFKNVKQTPVKPTPSRDPVDMARLVQVYGQTFLKNLVLEGEKLPKFETGPITYTDAKYEVSGEAGAIQVGFEVSMEMEVKPPQGGSGDSSTITFDAIRVDYDQEENTVTLTGDVAAEETKNFVSYRDITVEKLTFEGTMPEGKPLSLKINGSGTVKSNATEFEITLKEHNGKYVLILKLKDDITLAEILNHVFQRGAPPGTDKIVLNDVETSSNRDYVAGTASLAGEDVKFAAFKPENQNFMVAIEHRALQLANYLPQLANTPVKKLGLGRSIFIMAKDIKNPNGQDVSGPTLEITEANKNTLPLYIVEMLNDLEDEATAKTFGKSIYPLTLRANGTTIVALYTTDENQVSGTNEDEQEVINKLNITHDTYILKGFVNKDMIRAARYAKKQAGGSGPSTGSAIRGAVLPLLDGLDIGFPIPGFKPPKTGDWITFSESKFRLKGIDEKLEIFVSSGMSVKLPGSGKTGIRAMDMVGKVKPVVLKKNLEVEFAATTQLTGNEADETPFARLKALNDPDAEEAVSGLVPTSEKSQGWQKAFGIPFLTVEQMSVGGSFTDGGTTGDVKVNVGMRTIVEDQTPGQKLVLKGELIISDIHEIEDIVLEIPGSVKIAALPGINDIPGIDALTFSDVKLSRYELAGQVEGRGATLDGVLSRDPESEDYALYLAAKDTNLGTFSQHLSRKLPSTFGDFPIQSGVMVGSNMETQPNIMVEDLPERAQALFEGIVENDAEITIVKGVSVFTKLEPEKLPESNKFRKLMVSGFGFKEPLLFEGAIQDSGGSATPKVWLAANVPNYKIPGVSDKVLEFTGSKFFLEDISGALTGSVEGEMTFKVKGQQFALEEGKVSASVDDNDNEVAVTGVSTQEWKKAFGIPFLTLNRLELDINVKTAGPDVDWLIKTESVLNKGKPKSEQAFDANGQLVVVENVVEDIVLELPGTVDIRKLPAIGKVPGLNQLSYSDVKLSVYEIAANVLWTRTAETGAAKEVAGVFVRDRDKADEVEYRLYSAVQSINVSNLVELFSKKAANAIPSTLKDFPIDSGIVVIGNQDNETLQVSDLPERVQPLFTGYFPPERELTIVKGASVYTTIARDNTKKDDPVWGLLFGSSGLNLSKPVTFEGSIIKEQEDKAKVRLAASIPTYKIPGVPESILKFENSEMVFSNEDGKDVAVQGEMTLKGPDKPHKLDGSVTFVGSGNNKEAKVTGTKRGDWDGAFGIPGLTLSDLTLSVEKKSGNTSSTGLGIETVAAFGGQTNLQTTGALAIADGKLAGASFTLLGTVSMSTVPGIREIPGMSEFTFTDVVLSRNLIAGSNLIAGKTTWNRIAKDKKLDAAFIEKDNKFAMLMKVDSFSIGQLSSRVPAPVSKVTIPESVVALSKLGNDELLSLEVDGLPEPVRKTLFDPIIGETTGQKIEISDGLTVLTKLKPVDLLKPLPDAVKTAMNKAVEVKEPVVAAGTIGGVFGGDPSAALYVQIPNAVIPGKELLEKTLNFRDVKFFIRAEKNAVSKIGFGGAMDFNMPRLDEPGKFDKLDLAGELYMDLGVDTPGIEIAGKMTGPPWKDPMGFKDFTFKDVEVKVGVETGSVDVGLGGLAEYNSAAQRGIVYYAMDLLVGIIPGTIVPKKLAVQFVGKKKEGDNLVDGARIGPMTMMEMADSVFRGVLTGGMSNEVINQIRNTSAKKAAKQLQQLVRNNSLLGPLEKIPLPLLSVRDPKIYLSTPGAGLPAREGLEQPPFGLGAIMSGQMDFTLLGVNQNLANADMRLTLTDGLRIKADFPEKNLHVIKTGANLDVQAGLFNLGSASFKMSGKAELFSPLNKLGGKASFDMGVKQSGPLTNPTMHMNGSAKAGPFNRKAALKVAPTEIDFYSPAECTSPVSVSVEASYGDFKSFQFHNLIPQVVPKPKEVFNCNPLDLVNWIGNAGKKVGEGIVKGGEVVGKGIATGARRTVDAAREAVRGAQDAVNTASSALRSAADFVSNTIPFKDGLNRARQAWGDAIRKVPVLGSALGEFSNVVGGAASTAINESVNAARKAGNAISEGAKYLNPGNWGSFSANTRGALVASGPQYDPALENAIKANPHFQRAPEHVKARILQATIQLEHKLLQEKQDIYRASQQRQDLEWRRQAQIGKLNALHKEVGKQVWLSGNASDCPHGEYWNIELGQCWLDGYALLKTNRWVGKSSGGDDTPKCMAVDRNGALWKDWCATYESAKFKLQAGRDSRFKINEDGTIQTPDGKCLGIREKAGNIGKNPQVLALACSGAKTQKWRFDIDGRIVMEMAGLVNAQGKRVEQLCITQLSKGGLYPNVTDEALHLADCDGVERETPFDWTPAFGTPDYRGRERVRFPETAMLKIVDNLCLNMGESFVSQPYFLPCNDRNGRQLFAFAFVDEKYFTIASRSAGTCLDASDIVDRTGPRLVDMPCDYGETQQFYLASTHSGEVRIGNRKTGQCVSSSNTTNTGFAYRRGATLISAHRGAGLISAPCNNPRTTSFRMAPVNDITRINMDKWAPRPSSTEKQDQLRAAHLNKTFYIHPAGHPTNRIRAQHINYFGLDWRKVYVEWTSNSSHPDEVSHSKFQIVPGLTGEAGTVSLKSVGMSGPPGSFPHTERYLYYDSPRRQFLVFKIKLDDRFNKAATFKMLNGFSGNPGHITFKSVTNPETFLWYHAANKHGGQIFMAPPSDPAFSPAAASFVAVRQ